MLNFPSPDMARTCCPQYTIRLDIEAFKPNRKHRQVMNRWNRFLSTGQKPDDSEQPQLPGSNGKHKGKAKEPNTSEDFLSTLRAYELGFGEEGKHRFEVDRPNLFFKSCDES